MESESRVVSIIFTGAKIAGALCAFICAMQLGASWKMEITAFFNVVQLIVLVYAVAVLVLRIAKTPDSNFWKVETVASMVLGILEIAAASVWEATRAVLLLLNTLMNRFTPNMEHPALRTSTSNEETTMMFMIVFGYITGIICLLHAVYVVMKN